MSRQIVLASASPRRKEIMQAAGYDFIVLPADVDETCDIACEEDMVMELARRKALASKDMLPEEILRNPDGYMVIGSDTLVFLDGNQLGKPENTQVWHDYIRRLSGRTHKVITGVCIVTNDFCDVFSETTYVDVADMTESEIEAFVNRGEDIDKAGGYAIQGYFASYIPRINGEYNNVVGFPIAAFKKRISELGIEI